jgi:hypothetical protein
MAIRYFAMKHVSKPRDHSSNKQDSSSKPQDAHSKHGKQSDRQPDRQPDRQHEKQHDRQPGKSKCPDCGKSHPGACHTNITSNNLNPTPKPSNPSSNKQSTKTTELAADSTVNKNYFAKAMAETSQHNWHIDNGANYTTTPDKAWFVTYEPKENKHIKIGNKKLQKVKEIGTVELPNGLRIQNVRHTPSIKVNLIVLADLRHYKPRYQWETAEFLLHIDDTTTIRVPISDRLWPMHFKAIPTPKPRTPKQNAQEAQTPTKAPATATTTAATTATTKKVKGKAKRRALPLKRWHKRLNHLNYADVKQLATHSSQIKLANNKKLFCESCAYGKQHTIPNHKPQTRAEAIFDLIHINLGGGKNSLPKTNSRMLTFDDNIPPTPKGVKYFMIITDDYSRHRWFFTLKRKSDAAKRLKEWVTII